MASIYGIGTDIVEIARIQSTIEQYGEQFLSRVFTIEERNYCDSKTASRFHHYAVRFAYKEAFSKAIGTGVNSDFLFRECGIKRLPSGKSTADLRGRLGELYSGYEIHISLSHSHQYATAMVIIESAD